MSLDNMTKAELVSEAEEYGISTEGTKAELLERLKAFEATGSEEAVEESAEEVVEEEAAPAEAEEPKTEEPAKENLKLVKMERSNARFEAVGKVFTTKHPFHLVTEDEEAHLVDVVGGFRPATQREIENFYQ